MKAGSHHCSFVKHSSHPAGTRCELFSDRANTDHPTRSRAWPNLPQWPSQARAHLSSCCILAKVLKPKLGVAGYGTPCTFGLRRPKPADSNCIVTLVGGPKAGISCSQRCWLGTKLLCSHKPRGTRAAELSSYHGAWHYSQPASHGSQHSLSQAPASSNQPQAAPSRRAQARHKWQPHTCELEPLLRNVHHLLTLIETWATLEDAAPSEASS